ncbi:hypothetical protein ACOSP7_028023 [Xanthoceras sorbifolium]
MVDMESKIPLILERPFLATANALINCRNGLMKLTFGNMTLEVNIFHIWRQPHQEDECYYTYMIDSLMPEELHWKDKFESLECLLLENDFENLSFPIDAFNTSSISNDSEDKSMKFRQPRVTSIIFRNYDKYIIFMVHLVDNESN